MGIKGDNKQEQEPDLNPKSPMPQLSYYKEVRVLHNK